MAIKSILVVDDSMSSRLVLRNMLQQYRVDVMMVGSVAEANDHLGQHKPDAIFLDRYMPGTNGIQALKQLKADSVTRTIPVVMFTSLGPDEDTEDLVELGAIGVLPKPFSEKALSEIMSELDQVQSQIEDSSGGAVKPLPRASTKFDRRALQPLLQAMLEDAMTQQITPLIDSRVAELGSNISAGLHRQTEETAKDAAKLALSQAMKQVSSQTAHQLNRVLNESLLSQENNFSKRLEALEKRFEQQMAGLTARVDDIENGGHSMDYSMMDAVVEENFQGEEWPAKDDDSEYFYDDSDIVADSENLVEPRRRFNWFIPLVAIVVVVIIAYLYWSFAT